MKTGKTLKTEMLENHDYEMEIGRSCINLTVGSIQISLGQKFRQRSLNIYEVSQRKFYAYLNGGFYLP